MEQRGLSGSHRMVRLAAAAAVSVEARCVANVPAVLDGATGMSTCGWSGSTCGWKVGPGGTGGGEEEAIAEGQIGSGRGGRRGEARRGEERRGEARRGEERRGEARRGEERRGRQGEGGAAPLPTAAVSTPDGQQRRTSRQPVPVKGRPHRCLTPDVLDPLVAEPFVLVLAHRVCMRAREHKVPIGVDRVEWAAYQQHGRVHGHLGGAAPLRPVTLHEPHSAVGDAFAFEAKLGEMAGEG